MPWFSAERSAVLCAVSFAVACRGQSLPADARVSDAPASQVDTRLADAHAGPLDARRSDLKSSPVGDAVRPKDQAHTNLDYRICKTTPSADENDWIEAKNERCCGELVQIDILFPGDAGACFTVAPPSAKLCTFCGDKFCTPPENRCNCSADCH